MAPQVGQLQVAVVRGRHSWERRGRRGGRGQPISRFPQVVCGVSWLGVDLHERLVGRVGAVGIVGGGGGGGGRHTLGTPRGAVQAGPRGWEGAARRGLPALLGTCCVTGLQSESRELRSEVHAWALRFLATGSPSAEAPAPAFARALVAFGGRPYGPVY